MPDFSYALFETALGRCGLAWGEAGIVAASFCAGEDAATVSRLKRRARGAEEAVPPPADIQHVIDDIVGLFEGEGRDLADARLDLAGVSEFDCAVYELSRRIMPGETRTYGDLAKALGDVSLSRRVGQSLGANPIPIIIPCHRIVGAGGTMTGFSAPGGTETKYRLLKIEGALAPDLFDLA